MKRIVLYLCTALVWFATLPAVVAQQAKKIILHSKCRNLQLTNGYT